MNRLLAVVAVVVLAIIFIYAVKFAVAYYRAMKSIEAWAHTDNAECETAAASEDCAALLTPMAAPPAPATSWNAQAAGYAMQLTSAVIADDLGNRKALSMPGFAAPVMLDIPQDAPALGAVWVSPDATSALVAFRGTRTAYDIAQDLAYEQAAYPRPYTKPQRAQQNVQHLLHDVKVHAGFLAVFMEFRAHLHKAIPATVTRIFIAGHSLGAALAFIAALDLGVERLGAVSIEVHGLAPPRAGNAEFVGALASVATAYSLINLADIVPTMPMSFTPGFHPDYTPIAYMHAGELAAFSRTTTDIATNHFLATYLEGLISAAPVGHDNIQDYSQHRPKGHQRPANKHPASKHPGQHSGQHSGYHPGQQANQAKKKPVTPAVALV